jgi:hypothetical protein
MTILFLKINIENWHLNKADCIRKDKLEDPMQIIIYHQPAITDRGNKTNNIFIKKIKYLDQRHQIFKISNKISKNIKRISNQRK